MVAKYRKDIYLRKKKRRKTEKSLVSLSTAESGILGSLIFLSREILIEHQLLGINLV